MKGSSFLAMMTGGLFNGFLPQEIQCPPPDNPSSLSPVNTVEERGRKRTRETDQNCPPGAGSRTPTLVTPSRFNNSEISPKGEERPSKRLRGERKAVPVLLPTLPSSQDPQLQSNLLRILPEEVVGHVLSFLTSVSDRFALQSTCLQFRRISNSDEMLVNIKLGGDMETGKNGIIQEDDTPATAAASLTPFARAGNLEAIYMLGMIKSYCHQDVDRGIFLLKLASSRGFVRSSYALGIILRDSLPEESSRQMHLAASKGYLPALQEILPAREMKAKYGEPDASELRRHLDPICLNRLLGRHYLHCSHLRDVNTSHCWNPLCGRWAFKATAGTGNAITLRMRRPFSFAFFRYPADAGPGGRAQVQPRVNHISMSNDSNRSPGHGADQRDLPGDPSSSHQTNEDEQNEESVPADSPSSAADVRVSRMKMCSRCCRAKYCSKLCQVYDWRSGRHKMECQFL